MNVLILLYKKRVAALIDLSCSSLDMVGHVEIATDNIKLLEVITSRIRVSWDGVHAERALSFLDDLGHFWHQGEDSFVRIERHD